MGKGRGKLARLSSNFKRPYLGSEIRSREYRNWITGYHVTTRVVWADLVEWGDALVK